MKKYSNEIHHFFIEALLDKSYSTAWSLINNGLALNGFDKTYACLDDKPILTYIETKYTLRPF